MQMTLSQEKKTKQRKLQTFFACAKILREQYS